MNPVFVPKHELLNPHFDGYKLSTTTHSNGVRVPLSTAPLQSDFFCIPGNAEHRRFRNASNALIADPWDAGAAYYLSLAAGALGVERVCADPPSARAVFALPGPAPSAEADVPPSLRVAAAGLAVLCAGCG